MDPSLEPAKKGSSVGVIVGLCVLLLVGVALVLVALQWRKTHQHQAMVLRPAALRNTPAEGADGANSYAVVQNAAFQIGASVNPRFETGGGVGTGGGNAASVVQQQQQHEPSKAGVRADAEYGAQRKLPAVYLTNDIGAPASAADYRGGGGGNAAEGLPEYATPSEFDAGAGPKPVALTANILYQSADGAARARKQQQQQQQQQMSGHDNDYAEPNALYTGVVTAADPATGAAGEEAPHAAPLASNYADANELYAGSGYFDADVRVGVDPSAVAGGGGAGSGAAGTAPLASDYADANELYAGSGDLDGADGTDDGTRANILYASSSPATYDGVVTTADTTAAAVGTVGTVAYVEPNAMQPALYDSGTVPGFSFKGANRNRIPTYAEPTDGVYSSNLVGDDDGGGGGDGTRGNVLYEPADLANGSDLAMYAEVDEAGGFRPRGDSFV